MSSVLRSIEGPTFDRIVARPSMSRPSKKGIVASRMAVAGAVTSAPATAGVSPALPDPIAHVALEAATHAIDGALDSGARRAPNRPSPSASPSSAVQQDSERVEPRAARNRRRANSTANTNPWQSAERSLERRIRAHLPKGELTVRLTDNRYTMISVRRETKGGKRYKVRLHHMFAEASPTITRALARYVALNDREASKLLGDFIDQNQHLVNTRERKSATPKLITEGEVHDLADIFDSLNQHYFDGTIEARITWGQRSAKPKRRNSIKMGSYSVEDQLIRIHRSLDRSFVPRFFVEWVVYHEMLHQVHDIKVVNGRRQFHSREFLRDEAKFERYAEARAWERANLDALLTY